MLKLIYNEIKYIIRAALGSYRTTIAGLICVTGTMYLLQTGQISGEMAITLLSIGGALIVGKDHPFTKQP